LLPRKRGCFAQAISDKKPHQLLFDEEDTQTLSNRFVRKRTQGIEHPLEGSEQANQDKVQDRQSSYFG
jgi:hypothetical protein